MAFPDLTRKVMFPSRLRADGSGSTPKYWQYWIEEGVTTIDREVGVSQWMPDGTEGEYVDWSFFVPPGGFVLPPGDYVVCLPYLTFCAANECGITVSYRCDAGAHIDTAGEVFLDAPSPASSMNRFAFFPITVTAYTATTSASINIKVTSNDGFLANEVWIFAGQFTLDACNPYGLIGPCLALDVDEDDLDAWERSGVAVSATSPPASSHSAPIPLAGIPRLEIHGQGIYAHDVIEVTKYSDSNRADACNPADARIQCRYVRAEDVTVGVGGFNLVTRSINIPTDWSPGDNEYRMTPPDSCRNLAPTATVWAPSTAYAAGALVVPTYPNEHYYEAQDPGTSGATEPVWPTNGDTVGDNTVAAWEDQGERFEYDVNTLYRAKIRNRFPYDMIAKCGDDPAFAPVAYWRLGEAAGATTAVDEMGTLNLAYVGSPTLAQTGLLANDDDTCVTFDGTDDAATSATPLWAAASFPSAISLEATIYPTAASDTTYRRLFSTGDGADDYIEFVVEKLGAGNWVGHLYAAKDGVDYHKYTTNNYAHNATYHLVATYDASGPTVAIWLNGVKVASTAGAAPSAGYTGTAIGRLYGTAARFYTGKVDEFIVYDRVLTDQEIEGHYRASTIGSTVISTIDVETLLDRSKVLSVDTSITAPVLDAEPNATTADYVTTTWSDPAGYTDPQPLGYQVKMTMPDGTVFEKVVGTRNYYDWGQLPPGTYTWTVKSIDPWGSVSAYAAEDSFVVTLSSSAPICTLDPIPRTVYSQPLIGWSWQDVDPGHVQTAYEVEVATNITFATKPIDTGMVASTALSYQCAGLANGTYYVRARVYTTEWSDWDQDSFVLADPTSQSALVELFRIHPESTPGNLVLSKIWTPIGSVAATRKYGSSGGFEFTINNIYPFVERSLVAAHLMDEVSGAVAHDIVSGYNLALVGSPPWTGNVLNLVGAADYGYSGALDFTLNSEFTAFVVLYPSCTSGVLWFLGAYANNSNWYDVYSNGAGKLRVTTPAADSADLTVATASWVILRVKRVSTTLTLTNYSVSPATSVTVASGAYTGTPRLAIGRYMGSTPASTLSSGKVAAHLLYSDNLTDAEDARNVQALKEYLLHRGVSV